MWWEDLNSLSPSSRNSAADSSSSSRGEEKKLASADTTTVKVVSSSNKSSGSDVIVDLVNQDTKTAQEGAEAAATSKSVVNINMVTSEEFRKMETERQTEELYILVQRLLPLVAKVDNLTDTVSEVSSRTTHMEERLHKNPLFLPVDPLASMHHHHTQPLNMNGEPSVIQDEPTQGSDSMFNSMTSLENSVNKPDPFIIKRSREINK